jgi:DNA processing protein
MTGRIAPGLAAAGVVVVSGLARGVDSAAHRGALDMGGRTVAVLACGLGRSVASEDPDLPARIEACGALASEFPLDVRALRGHFPRRNRLLSGLSVGTVVVEAAAKSGSLLTARWALDQDRCVMAVPGRADNPMAKGSNGLLRRGAALVEGPEDVLREIGLGEPPEEVPAAGMPDDLHGRIGPSGATLDELAEGSGRAPEELLTDLLRLEIAGLVRLAPGGIYRRIGNLE